MRHPKKIVGKSLAIGLVLEPHGIQQAALSTGDGAAAAGNQLEQEARESRAQQSGMR
jgi:hypothetical protein